MNIELKITLWALACAYAIANSFIYSLSFWSTFDIDILQFASFSEIFPAIIYTIAIPCILVVIGFAMVDFWQRLQLKIHNFIDNQMSAKIKNYELIKNTALALTSLACIIFGVYGIISAYNAGKETSSTGSYPWEELMKASIPLCVAFLAIYLINKKTTFLIELKVARKVAILIICTIPVVCYYWGYVNSTRIKNGINTLLVQSDGQCKSSPNTQYRYISSISDKAFAISLADSSICVFKYNSLSLTPEKNNKKLQPVASNSI